MLTTLSTLLVLASSIQATPLTAKRATDSADAANVTIAAPAAVGGNSAWAYDDALNAAIQNIFRYEQPVSGFPDFHDAHLARLTSLLITPKAGVKSPSINDLSPAQLCFAILLNDGKTYAQDQACSTYTPGYQPGTIQGRPFKRQAGPWQSVGWPVRFPFASAVSFLQQISSYTVKDILVATLSAEDVTEFGPPTWKITVKDASLPAGKKTFAFPIEIMGANNATTSEPVASA